MRSRLNSKKNKDNLRKSYLWIKLIRKEKKISQRQAQVQEKE